MRRQRVRPAWGPDDLARIYAEPHDHRRFGRGHGERVDATIEVAKHAEARTAADLSCGNAAILNALDLDLRVLGDYAPGYEFTGPIDATIHQIPYVDLFVCSETIEHLENPDAVLKEIRTAATQLVLSTPIGAWDDGNAEHYWAWDQEAVEAMMSTAGFAVVEFTNVDSTAYQEPYNYGIWRCT